MRGDRRELKREARCCAPLSPLAFLLSKIGGARPLRCPQEIGVSNSEFFNYSGQSKRPKKIATAWVAIFLGLARPERFELPTPWFVAKYSIQMSYGRFDA